MFVDAEVEPELKSRMLMTLELHQARAASGEDATKVSKDYVAEMQALLSEAAFKDTQWCYQCQTMCVVHPEPELEVVDVNVAGYCCQAWSAMGSQQGWLSASSIPWMIWAHSTAAACPDLIVGECTTRFDVATLIEVIGENYVVQELTFTPVQLGYPISRPRQYVVAIRRVCQRSRFSPTLPALKSIFGRALAADARVFFRAPESRVAAAKADLAQRQHVSETLAWSELLSSEKRLRLEEFTRQACERGYTFFVVDLNQRPTFFQVTDKVCPSMLRRSYMYGRRVNGRPNSTNEVNRIMVLEEHFATEILPVLLPHTHPLTQILPSLLRYRATSTCKDISASTYKSMAGNGMVLPAVGAVLLLSLLGVEPP